MSKINQLSNAIKFALFVGATASLATASAFAQEKEEAKEIQAVEVTGSRIKRVDAETSQPIQVITRADIEKTGLTNVFDLLNNITASDGSGLSTVTTQTNGSDGAQTISLRGLGASRTLVLVDGKRWVSEDGIVDTTTIPTAIIERIDILKDGASAIYGSDAVAGVVNIITRKNYDGAQVGVSYGQYAPGDGAQKAIDITVGATGERSNVVFGASFTEYEPVFAGDRQISKVSRPGCTTPVANSGACGSFFSEYGVFTGPALPDLYSWNPGSVGTIADPGQYHSNGVADRYNFSPINYLKQPSKITNLFFSGRFNITDNVSAYARASYTKRASVQQLAPVPLTISNYGSFGPQWTFGATADNVFNPFGQDVDFIGYRMSGAGPRRLISDHDALGIQLGLEGAFSIGDRNFSWDLMGQRNDYQFDNRGENYVNLFNLERSLGPSGYDAASRSFYCGASFAAAIQGCVPFNLFQGPTFGLGQLVAPASPGVAERRITAADVASMLDYVTYTQVATRGYTSVDYTGNLTGDMFELPGGMASFAVGFESRRDTYFAQPDTLVSSGGSSDNFVEPTSGSVEVNELYAEFVFPIVKDLAFAKELEFKAAVRRSNYDSQGLIGNTVVTPDIGNPTNTQFGVRWKPIDDLLIRASVGETFRAPSVGQLFGGGAENFPQAEDPCNQSNWAGLGDADAVVEPGSANLSSLQAACVATGVAFTNDEVGGAPQPNAQVRSLGGGDPSLKPEFGDNKTVGLVYSPNWLEGFDMSLDYWKIDLNDYIVAFGAQETMERCIFNNIATACGNVTRNAAGQVTQVRTAQGNVARFIVSGYDLGVGYKWDAGSWGKFGFKVDTTYVKQADFTDALGVVTDSTGNYTGNPNFEYRSTANISWTKGDWGVNWTTRYVSELVEKCRNSTLIGACNDRGEPSLKPDGSPGGLADRNNYLGAYAVHDVNVTWKAPWDARVSLGARNLFGKEPPPNNRAFAHSFDAAYDLPGGAYWYAQYRQDF